MFGGLISEVGRSKGWSSEGWFSEGMVVVCCGGEVISDCVCVCYCEASL